MIAGKALVQTVAHFFPDWNDWLDQLPDRRDPEAITYETRFMGWWGIALYLCQLGSRRQLDYELDARDTWVLGNLNRLANTNHKTRPVHDTLDYFVEHLGPHGLPGMCTKIARRLIRMKALDAARLAGKYVVPIDGTGTLCFHRRHCPHCLVQRREKMTLYLHNVLEAKLLGPAGVLVSVASEFIENADAAAAQGKGADRVKQDCELKAYLDDQGRRWQFNALQCEETTRAGVTTLFAWITDLALTRATVVDIAEKGGRSRWKIENEGFNRQKNSGLNLSHVYSIDPEKWKAYYYLLQIAFILMQLLERGSLLKRLAAELSRTPLQLFGSLKNLARRLLDALRYQWLPEESFDTSAAKRLKIHLDSS